MIQFKKYKLLNGIITILLIHFICFAANAQEDYQSNEIYFKLKTSTPIELNRTSSEMRLEQFDKIINQNMVRKYSIETVKAPFHFSKSTILNRTFRMKFRDKKQMDDLLSDLNRHQDIEYAERIPIDQLHLIPDDLGTNTTGGQWGLYKIAAISAWDVTTGDANIVVAVVDDAIQTTHEDLTGKCLAGWDVADDDNDTNPVGCHDHGTHVAGIVGANTNNGMGVASIGYNVSILPVKATEDTYSCGYITHGYAGITWAADNGADVINMSWGGSTYSTTNANVIAYAWSQGCILVASAGNDYSSSPKYPANYDDVISVAATNINDEKASFSNYGDWVDIAAPGVSIRSTVISGGYANWNGTSMASPMVAGLCGLVWSVDPSQDQQDIVDCVLNTADNIDTENPAYIGLLGSGRINAHEAVQCALTDTCPTNLNITQTYTNGDFADLEADNHITSTSTIESGANVTFDAGSEITLLPGFNAQAGCDFLAVIDGCGGVYKTTDAPKIAVQPQTETIISELKCFPNPFSESMILAYTLAKDQKISLSIFNPNGQEITRLLENATQMAGSHEITFDGQHLPNGLYFYRFTDEDGNILTGKISKF